MDVAIREILEELITRAAGNRLFFDSHYIIDKLIDNKFNYGNFISSYRDLAEANSEISKMTVQIVGEFRNNTVNIRREDAQSMSRTITRTFNTCAIFSIN